MALKDYSDEFRADAVALFKSTPGATHKGIAADVGISRGTSRAWVPRGRAKNGKPWAAHPRPGVRRKRSGRVSKRA